MSKYQEIKRIVRNYYEALENSNSENIKNVLNDYVSDVSLPCP